MKKIVGLGFVVILLMTLTAGSPVHAENGNLDLNDQVLSGTDESTKVSDQNIEYEVAPDLFMKTKTTIVKKAQQADEDKIATANTVNFSKSKAENDQINSNQSEKGLFASKSVDWNKTGTGGQSSIASYSEQIFTTWLIRIVLGLLALAVVVAGIFIGQKYSERIRTLGRKKN